MIPDKPGRSGQSGSASYSVLLIQWGMAVFSGFITSSETTKIKFPDIYSIFNRIPSPSSEIMTEFFLSFISLLW